MKKEIVLYPKDETVLAYYNLRLKQPNGKPSIYVLDGNYWKVRCIGEDGLEYLVFYKYEVDKYGEEIPYDVGNYWCILKDYTHCDDWRLAWINSDDPIEYTVWFGY